MHHIILALADGVAAPTAGGPAGCAGGGLSSFVPLILMFAIFYFMLIRPQQKKAKDHQTFLSGLKKGDQVITRGGVVGRVTGVTDTMVTLEVQEKVRVRVLKSYIDGQHRDATASADKPDKPEKPDKSDKKKDEPSSSASAT